MKKQTKKVFGGLVAIFVVLLAHVVSAQTPIGTYGRWKQGVAVGSIPPSGYVHIWFNSSDSKIHFTLPDSSDATVSSGSGSFLPLAGGTMSGPIVLSGTQTGTYTLGGTPTITAPVINGATSASGNFNLSGSSGTFLTSTGAATFGGSSNSFTNSVSSTGFVGSATGTSKVSGAFALPVNTFTPGFTLENTTPSLVGVTVEDSPMMEFIGHAWKSNATAADETDKAALVMQPVTGGAATTAALAIVFSLNGGAYARYWDFSSSSTLKTVQTSMTLSGAASNGATATNVLVDGANAFSTAGATSLLVRSGGSATGQLRYGLTSGLGAGAYASIGEDLTCSGTCTEKDVLCWAGTDGATVAQCAATINLTTVAGVAMVTVTNAVVKVARHGRVQVACDTVAVGNPVSTSGGTAGRVQAAVPPLVNAMIGRATTADASSLCAVDLNL